MSFSLIDRILHPSLLQGDAEQVRLARTTATFVVASWFFAPMLLPVMVLVGDQLAVWSCAIGAVFVVVPLTLLRRGRRDLAAHMELLSLVAGLMPAIIAQGGIRGSAIDWITIVPLLATFLLPGRGAVWWLIIAIATLVGFGALSVAGVDTTVATETDATIRVWASQIAIALCVFVLARAFESNKTRMGTELERARKAAEEARHDAQRVLDNVDQGLFTVDARGQIGPGISRAATRWFGTPTPGTGAAEWLGKVDADAAIWLDLAIDAHHEGILPPEVTLAQLPRQIASGGRTYALRWLGTEREIELLAVATDVTEVVLAERAERVQRELIAALHRFNRDRYGFLEFLEEGDAIVESLASAHESDPIVDARHIHTLKGNASLFGLASFAAYCHGVEVEMVENAGKLPPAARRGIGTQWHELRARLDPFLGVDGHGVVQVPRADLERMLAATAQRRPHEELHETLASWTFEPTRVRLGRIAEQARALADRLGKEELEVVVDDGGVLLAPKQWASFWSAFTHALRNAVDHGIETAFERLAAGKPARGRLSLRTSFDGDELVIAIRDDGRGVAWSSIAVRAREMGLPAESREDLERALLTDGVTTAVTVSSISGRGVGMAALAAEAQRLYGRIAIASVADRGTTFEFRFPASMARQEAVVATAA